MKQDKNTVDLTPPWEEVGRMIVILLENGDAEGKKQAKAQLKNMAKIADAFSWTIKNPVQVLVHMEDGVIQNAITNSDIVQLVVVEIDDNGDEPVVLHDYTAMEATAEPLSKYYKEGERDTDPEVFLKLKALNF